jgi:hypothetical protein
MGKFVLHRHSLQFLKYRSRYGIFSFYGMTKMQPYTITLIVDTATMIKYNNIWKAKTVCIINDKR